VITRHHTYFTGSSWLHYACSGLGLAIILILVARYAHLHELGALLAHANPGWLLAALLFKLLAPFGTAAVYQRVLRHLGYDVSLRSIWLPVQLALFINVAAPAGILVMSTFLVYVFQRRGIRNGTMMLTAIVERLAYYGAFLSLAGLGVAYLFGNGELHVRQIRVIVSLALALILGSLYLWGLQRDRADLTRKIVRLQQTLARRLHRSWSKEHLLALIDELYNGKALLARHPGEIVRLVVCQVAGLLCDVMTLYYCIRALGTIPHLSLILLGYVLATFLASVAPIPAGGGTYEATLVLTMNRLGMPLDNAIGATLLYRLLAFWLPMLISAVSYRRLLGSGAGTNAAPLDH
jgi:uncharacterized protein (TIRG00374 family)